MEWTKSSQTRNLSNFSYAGKKSRNMDEVFHKKHQTIGVLPNEIDKYQQTRHCQYTSTRHFSSTFQDFGVWVPYPPIFKRKSASKKTAAHGTFRGACGTCPRWIPVRFLARRAIGSTVAILCQPQTWMWSTWDNSGFLEIGPMFMEAAKL